MGLAAGALALAGGPQKLRLSPGVMGVMQALSLGSTLGSLSAMACIYAIVPKVEEDEDE